MKYIIRTTTDCTFDTIEEAREFRNNLPDRTEARLIVSQGDPFGSHFEVHPASAKQKRK